MNTKHTPGPWKVNATPHSSNQNFVVLDSGANGHSKRIAAVYSDRDEADAALIAAAPDLAEALRDVLLWGGDQMPLGISQPAINALRKAGIEP